MDSETWKSGLSIFSETVDVSVINSTTYLRGGAGSLLMTPVYRGFETVDNPSYSFLIHHKKTNSRLLFDLGLRKNWKTHLSPHLVREIESLGLRIEVEKDVASILQEHGVQLETIGGIVLSHHHWDHTGNLTLFPTSTKLIVGPGHKAKYLPGWPKDPAATASTSDMYEGRDIIELDFAIADSKIGKVMSFQSYDWFGDGSLYFLRTPGHTFAHLSCLARTTLSNDTSTFMFLGGDYAHHCSLLRPSEYYPLPETISPAPHDAPLSNSLCSTQCFTSFHRARHQSNGEIKSRTTPFCLVPEGYVDEDIAETQTTVNKSLVLDGDENVFTVLAHDHTLLDVIDFFPKLATEWKAKRWDQQSRWRFLAPLSGGPA